MRPIELAAARYRLGQVSGQPLIALAEELLAEGHDEAVKLAIADDPAMSEIGPLFEALCSQLGQPIPDPHEAADIITTAILCEILAGSLKPQPGLAQLMDDVYYPHVANEGESGVGHYVGETHDLHHLIGAFWSYAELRERPTELSIDGKSGEAATFILDSQVRQYAQDWLTTHRVKEPRRVDS